MKIYKILFAFVIFTAIIAVPPLILRIYYNCEFLVARFWLLFLFISFLTLMVVVFVLMVQRKNKEMFAQAFLGGTTFKLLACLIFVLIFIRKNHPDKLYFIADFMYLYLLNTGFEVYGLLRNLRNQNLK